MYIFWQGRGYWVIFLAALAMFAPLIGLRQVDGPEVDRWVAITMSLAAAAAIGLGLFWNRGKTFSTEARAHSFWGVPVQLWALPMILFAAALGTGLITTAEEPRPRPRVEGAPNGGR